MKERTEDDILSQAPVKVKLGEKEYELKPLTCRKAREWRLKLSESLSVITASFGQSPEPGNLGPALTSALISFPEKLLELVFAYEPSLPRETILDEATEEQVASAFSVIMKLAFPFLGQLATTVQIMKASV